MHGASDYKLALLPLARVCLCVTVVRENWLTKTHDAKSCCPPNLTRDTFYSLYRVTRPVLNGEESNHIYWSSEQ